MLQPFVEQRERRGGRQKRRDVRLQLGQPTLPRTGVPSSAGRCRGAGLLRVSGWRRLEGVRGSELWVVGLFGWVLVCAEEVECCFRCLKFRGRAGYEPGLPLENPRRSDLDK